MSKRIVIIQRAVIAAVILLFIFGFFQVNQISKVSLMETEGRSFEKGKIIEIMSEDVLQGQQAGSGSVVIELLTGALKGEQIEAVNSASYLFGANVKVGSKVIVMISESGEERIASVFSNDREYILYGIILLFLVTIWIIGGKKGFYSIIGLVFTFICIIYLFLPMIYRGFSPSMSAILVVILTTTVTMYLIGGMSKKTLSSIIGTVMGVSVAGILAAVFSKVSYITGYNVSEVESLIYIQDKIGIKVGELLFAGILIASLGAVMDVSMSISSTIQEIHEKNPNLSGKELFQSGINVGRDMMGTMSNTLILAFAGGSINTIVFIYAYNYEYQQMINMNSIAIELIQGIAASFGVILTVPFVSFVSAYLLSKEKKGHDCS